MPAARWHRLAAAAPDIRTPCGQRGAQKGRRSAAESGVLAPAQAAGARARGGRARARGAQLAWGPDGAAGGRRGGGRGRGAGSYLEPPWQGAPVHWPNAALPRGPTIAFSVKSLCSAAIAGHSSGYQQSSAACTGGGGGGGARMGT